MPSKTLDTLSEREKEILKHFCYSNTEIGKMLKISRLTVKSHSHNIFSKLNCKSRTAALVEAIKQDLIQPQEIHIKGKEEEE